MFKLLHNCTYFNASKVILKILQARLQQHLNRELSDVQSEFWRDRGTRDQIASIHWIMEKARGRSRKTSTSALLTTLKSLTVLITTNWKILKEIEITDHLAFLLRGLYAGQEATVRTRYWTMDLFKIGKGVHQACILSPCWFNLYAGMSCKMVGWMNHKLESRLTGEISTTWDMQMTPL